jgi:hypothetical protein
LGPSVFSLPELTMLNFYKNPALTRLNHMEYIQYRTMMFDHIKKLIYLENLVRARGAESIFIDPKKKHLYPLENDELSRWDLYQESEKSIDEESMEMEYS